MGATIESTFSSKPSRRSCRERHHHKPWFDADYRTTKRELKFWLKTNLDSHAAKHQESKLKNLLKMNFFLGNYKSSTYVCTFILEKIPTKGTRCGQVTLVTFLEGLRELVG